MSSEEGESACRVSENAQSANLGGILKNIYFTMTESNKRISQGENQK